MLDKCKNNECTCEQENNFFHVKVLPQNSANFSAAEEETFSSYEFEANSMLNIDSMGREKFWEDMGRP
jgi:hypothetical protein